MAFDRIPNINSFEVTGIIHADPVRGTGRNKPHVPYCRLVIKNDSPYFGQRSGHPVHNYSFFAVTVYNDLADRMAKAVKGDGVLVAGSLGNPVARTQDAAAELAAIELKVRRIQWLPRTVKQETEDDAPVVPF